MSLFRRLHLRVLSLFSESATGELLELAPRVWRKSLTPKPQLRRLRWAHHLKLGLAFGPRVYTPSSTAESASLETYRKCPQRTQMSFELHGLGEE